jgi:hypothetical protein
MEKMKINHTCIHHTCIHSDRYDYCCGKCFDKAILRVRRQTILECLGAFNEIIDSAQRFQGTGAMTDHELVDTCQLYIPLQKLKTNNNLNKKI